MEALVYNMKTNLRFKEISKLIKHRSPFLLIDKVIELEKKKSAIGIKYVTINENYFTGHFPDNPIMPGVLIVEASAQLCAITISDDCDENLIPVLAKIEGFKFLKLVVPGDEMIIKVELITIMEKISKFKVDVSRSDEKIASGTLIFSFINKS